MVGFLFSSDSSSELLLFFVEGDFKEYQQNPVYKCASVQLWHFKVRMRKQIVRSCAKMRLVLFQNMGKKPSKIKSYSTVSLDTDACASKFSPWHFGGKTLTLP